MDIQTVSTKQLRTEMPSIKARLQQGESFYWIDRSKPIGKIAPIEKKQEKVMNAKEYRKYIQSIAGGFAFKKSLSPKELNKLLEQRYEEMLPR